MKTILPGVVALACMAGTGIGWAQSAATGVSARPLALSLGTVKDRLESAATRALMQYANDTEIDDKLVNPEKTSFYVVRRKFDFDVTDKGSFGGVALRYGATRFMPTTRDVLVNGMTVTAPGWIHTVPMTLGLDADRSFKSRDILLEVGYVPFKSSDKPSCFKLGGNPIVGLVGQVGRRTQQDAPAGFERDLQRVKLELKSRFEIGRCFGVGGGNGAASAGVANALVDALAADIAKWQVHLEAHVLRDLAQKSSHHHAALMLRLPMANGAFMDLRREVGEKAPTFQKGAQFSAMLTVQY